MLNLSLAVVLLLLVGPIVANFDGKPAYVQAALVMVTAPVVLVALLCLSSAIRPGSLGRALRRSRRRKS